MEIRWISFLKLWSFRSTILGMGNNVRHLVWFQYGLQFSFITETLFVAAPILVSDKIVNIFSNLRKKKSTLSSAFCKILSVQLLSVWHLLHNSLLCKKGIRSKLTNTTVGHCLVVDSWSSVFNQSWSGGCHSHTMWRLITCHSQSATSL